MEHTQTSLSLQEVCKRLKKSVEEVRMAIKYGRLEAYKCGSKKHPEIRVGYAQFVDYVIREEGRKWGK